MGKRDGEGGEMQLDTIYCGDNAEVMGQWPDCCLDLTITSPPYDIYDGKTTHPNGLRAYNGYAWDFEAVARQLYRVTKRGGVCVWVVGDATVNGSETGTSFRQALYFMGLGFNLHDTMIYQSDKQPLNNNRYEPKFEYMFVFSKEVPKTFNPILEPSTYAGKKIGTSRKYNPDGSKEKWWGKGVSSDTKVRGNIWYIPNGHGKTTTDNVIHSGMFPESLARDHILSWSNPGDLVADPFCGSGTTLKQAVELGRHYIGIDTSSEYVALSQRRVDQARRPLFTL